MRTTNSWARAVGVLLAAALAVTTLVAPVAAAAPQDVTIVSPMTFNPDGFNFGTFEASGSAVDFR